MVLTIFPLYPLYSESGKTFCVFAEYSVAKYFLEWLYICYTIPARAISRRMKEAKITPPIPPIKNPEVKKLQSL